MKRLEGQIAIITGGARGIGEGICEVFCKEGAIVALWDVLDGEEVVTKISDKGGDIFYQKVDVTNQESVDAAVAEIIKKYQKIDILINNAGVIRDRSFLKMTREEWDVVMSVNVDSLFKCMAFCILSSEFHEHDVKQCVLNSMQTYFV